MKTLLAALLLLAPLSLRAADAGPAPKAGATPASLYNSKCASCHAKDGKGNAAMAKAFKTDAAALDLTDKATLDKTDADLDAVTKKGLRKMPAFAGKLSDQEISALTAYFRGFSTAKK